MSRKKRWNGPEHGGWNTTARGPGPYISIYCRGSAINPHDKWRIASLQLQELGDSVYWVESASGYADHDQPVLFTTHPAITQYLVNDRWVDRDDLDARRETGFRLRWSMRCALCRASGLGGGFSEVFPRPLDLTPAITELARLRAADGVLELSGHAFTSHVRRHASGTRPHASA